MFFFLVVDAGGDSYRLCVIQFPQLEAHLCTLTSIIPPLISVPVEKWKRSRKLDYLGIPTYWGSGLAEHDNLK